MSNYDRGVKHPKLKSCKVVIPNVFGTRDQFVEDKFSTDQRRSDGFGVIQFHYIYCTLYFYHNYILIYNEIIMCVCLTLLDPMDCSEPGSPVHEISQARILEWIAVPSSRRSSRPRD